MYGPQIVLLTCLSAMTMYRRELSCNRGFHDDNSSSEEEGEEVDEELLLSSQSDEAQQQGDGEEEGHRRTSSSRKHCGEVFNGSIECDDEDDSYSYSSLLPDNETTEKLLDGAGMYCSGAPLLAMVSTWLSCFEHDFEPSADCVSHDTSTTKKSRNHHRDVSLHNTNIDLWMDYTSTADLLDRVGNYCSGEPLIAAAQFLLSESSLYNFVTKALSDAVPSSSATLSAKSTLDSTSSTVDCSGENGHHHLWSYNVNLSIQDQDSQSSPLAFQQLPPDAHVQITSFLHPKDVVTMCCVSRSFRDVVDSKGKGGGTSMAIWKTLWYRDYAWIIHSWDVGQEAYQRSRHEIAIRSADINNDVDGSPLHAGTVYDKEFYFQFGQAYSDYILAGQNTRSRCLVGIYSNIYDITSFLDTHPGSPDTLMVHAGKDATRFFEDMGHSLIARRRARSLCVVIDASSTSCSADESTCGLHPTPHTKLSLPARSDSSTTLPLTDGGAAVSCFPLTEEDVPLPSLVNSEHALLGRKAQQQQLQQQRRKKRRTGTLVRIRNQYLGDRERNIQLSREKYSSLSFLGQANPYYDPFCQRWKCWYTDANLQVVFTDGL